MNINIHLVKDFVISVIYHFSHSLFYALLCPFVHPYFLLFFVFVFIFSFLFSVNVECTKGSYTYLFNLARLTYLKDRDMCVHKFCMFYVPAKVF